MNLLVFILCFCYSFSHILVFHCSIFENMDNFQQPTETAVEKCQILNSLVHYEPRNGTRKSVKSFVGHPVDREYKSGLINSAIQRARQTPKRESLKKVMRNKESQRPVFVISFDPRLPLISKIVSRHWRTMKQDPYLAQVFPLVAYKRPANIKDKLGLSCANLS